MKDTAPAKEPAKPESTKSEADKDGKQSSTDTRSPFRTVAFQADAKNADENKKSDEPMKEADPKKEDAPKANENAAESKPADPSLDPAARAEAEFERKRIIRENETKQKDYDAKIKEGQRKAKLLNERFAEWYYVIPDDVYRKIHLGKSDIIQRVKPAPGESTNPLKVPGPLQGLPPGFPPAGLMPK